MLSYKAVVKQLDYGRFCQRKYGCSKNTYMEILVFFMMDDLDVAILIFNVQIL